MLTERLTVVKNLIENSEITWMITQIIVRNKSEVSKTVG